MIIEGRVKGMDGEKFSERIEGIPPQVVVDASHADRARNAPTSCCFIALAALPTIGLVAGVRELWLIILTISLWVLAGVVIVLEVRHRKNPPRSSGRRPPSPKSRICANCKTNITVKEGAFVRASSQSPGGWYCHRCILELGKLTDYQSFCPKCGAITESLPLQPPPYNYYCGHCARYLRKGNI